MVPCLRALIKHVWMVAPCCIQASFQTRSDYGFVSVYKHLFPAPFIKHVWTVVLCYVQASIFNCVSNTFGGPWSVYIISQQPRVSNNRLILVSCLCTLPPTPKRNWQEKILHMSSSEAHFRGRFSFLGVNVWQSCLFAFFPSLRGSTDVDDWFRSVPQKHLVHRWQFVQR